MVHLSFTLATIRLPRQAVNTFPRLSPSSSPFEDCCNENSEKGKEIILRTAEELLSLSDRRFVATAVSLPPSGSIQREDRDVEPGVGE